MAETRDFFKKTRDTKATFYAKIRTVKKKGQELNRIISG